jgi:hypothetical protein
MYKIGNFGMKTNHLINPFMQGSSKCIQRKLSDTDHKNDEDEEDVDEEEDGTQVAVGLKTGSIKLTITSGFTALVHMSKASRCIVVVVVEMLFCCCLYFLC